MLSLACDYDGLDVLDLDLEDLVFLLLELLSSTAICVVVGPDLLDEEVLVEILVVLPTIPEVSSCVIYEVDGPRTEVDDPVRGGDLVVDVPVVCVLDPADGAESVCECDDPD